MKIKNIIISLISLVLIIGGISIGFAIYNQTPAGQFQKFYKEYYKSSYNRTYVSDDDFHTYYEDFCVILDIVLENKRETGNIEDTGFSVFSVNSYNGIWTLTYCGERIELSEEEQNSLKIVDNAFADASLDVIRIYENGVSFNTESDRYALVYSFDGSKPKFINWENYKLNIQNIRKNWYHVTGNG